MGTYQGAIPLRCDPHGPPDSVASRISLRVFRRISLHDNAFSRISKAGQLNTIGFDKRLDRALTLLTAAQNFSQSASV